MKVYVGTDHRGFGFKAGLLEFLNKQGHIAVDVVEGPLDPDDDYPIIARRLTAAMLMDNNRDVMGILVCGSGQGVCMAANRFKGIRACIGYDTQSVISARNDDDANILCMGVDILNNDQDHKIVTNFLNTPYARSARFNRRIKEMDEF